MATYYKEGEEAPKGSYKAGDFILTHGTAWYSKLIRFGQRVLYKHFPQYCYYNHAAFIASNEGELLEALADGFVKSHISKYKDTEYHVVHLDESDAARQRMIKYANRQEGKPYDWFCIASIVLTILLRVHIQFGLTGRLICSGAEGAILEHSDDSYLPIEPLHTMPADLACFFNVVPQRNSF